MSKTKRAAAEGQRQALTAVLVVALPRLLRKYQTDDAQVRAVSTYALSPMLQEDRDSNPAPRHRTQTHEISCFSGEPADLLTGILKSGWSVLQGSGCCQCQVTLARLEG